MLCAVMTRGTPAEWSAASSHTPHAHRQARTFAFPLPCRSSVRAFCKQWEADRKELHILICNAGIYAMGGELQATPATPA